MCGLHICFANNSSVPGKGNSKFPHSFKCMKVMRIEQERLDNMWALIFKTVSVHRSHRCGANTIWVFADVQQFSLCKCEGSFDSCNTGAFYISVRAGKGVIHTQARCEGHGPIIVFDAPRRCRFFVWFESIYAAVGRFELAFPKRVVL